MQVRRKSGTAQSPGRSHDRRGIGIDLGLSAALLAATMLSLPVDTPAGPSGFVSEDPTAALSPSGEGATTGTLQLDLVYSSENCPFTELTIGFRLSGTTQWQHATLADRTNPFHAEFGCGTDHVQWDYYTDLTSVGVLPENVDNVPVLLQIEASLGTRDIVRLAASESILVSAFRTSPTPLDVTGCDPPGSPLGPTPTPTPATPLDSGVRSTSVSGKYFSVGSGFPMVLPVPTAIQSALPPLAYSLSAQDGTLYSALTSQGTYDLNDLPNDTRASATLAGESSTVLGTLESAEGVTRGKTAAIAQQTDPGAINLAAGAGLPEWTATRYVIGKLYTGILTRGGSFWDAFGTRGAIRTAAAAPGDVSLNHVHTVQGSEFRVFVGNRDLVDSPSDPPAPELLDGRKLPFWGRTASLGGPTPAWVRLMTGVHSYVLSQTKRTENQSNPVAIGNSLLQLGSFFHHADGTYAEVVTRPIDGNGFVPDSQVERAVAVTNQLCLEESPVTDGSANRGQIETMFGAFIPWNDFAANTPPSDSASLPRPENGLVVWSQESGGAGSWIGPGSPVRSVARMESGEGVRPAPPVLPPESSASILTMDGNILGDGVARHDSLSGRGEGCDTDITWVGALHLTPSHLPAVSRSLPPPERVGMLCYREEGPGKEHGLYVSVAGRNASPWNDTPSYWVRVQGTNASVHEDEHPRLQLDNFSPIGGGVVFRARVSGLTSPSIYWRLVGVGRQRRGETAWTKASYTGAPAGYCTLRWTDGYNATPGWDSVQSSMGQAVQVIASEEGETRRSAGNSFVITALALQ